MDGVFLGFAEHFQTLTVTELRYSSDLEKSHIKYKFNARSYLTPFHLNFWNKLGPEWLLFEIYTQLLVFSCEIYWNDNGGQMNSESFFFNSIAWESRVKTSLLYIVYIADYIMLINYENWEILFRLNYIKSVYKVCLKTFMHCNVIYN